VARIGFFVKRLFELGLKACFTDSRLWCFVPVEPLWNKGYDEKMNEQKNSLDCCIHSLVSGVLKAGTSAPARMRREARNLQFTEH